MPSDRHEHLFRVRSYEIDAYRHVNNGAYVNWLEEGRERFLRLEGRDYAWYPEHCDAWFVVVRLEIDYRSPALANQEIRLGTRLAAIGRSSAVFRQLAADAADGRVLCRARVVMAFGDGEASVPVPDDFRERFTPSPEGDAWTVREGGERKV